MTTALEAFCEFFGYEEAPPSAKRHALAEGVPYAGGNTDPQTIASIPMQADRLAVRFFKENGRIPTLWDVASRVDLRKWEGFAEKGEWRRTSRRRKADVRHEAMRTIMWELYVENFDRPPDNEGGDFWLDEIEAALDRVKGAFIRGASPEDEARMEALKNG